MRCFEEQERTIWQFCYLKKQIDVSFWCVCLLTLNIVKVVCMRIHSAITSWIHCYFDNVMTKFTINNRTGAWKTDVNLLTVSVCSSLIPDQITWLRFENESDTWYDSSLFWSILFHAILMTIWHWYFDMSIYHFFSNFHDNLIW